VSCYRAGGITCYADTPEGQNREHCLWGGTRCVAVSPSDMGTASVALDAQMVIRGPSGDRVVPAEEFFVGPSQDIQRMTVLRPDELLVAVRYPKSWAGAKFYYEKVTDRNTWDFALVSVAAAMRLDGTKIKTIRMACGAVECVPRRLVDVEKLVTGSEKNEEVATRAGKLAVEGATTLNYNQFKVPLMENLVRRAIRDA
jgi:xanthine dehydrogenase YagS FAD-binding subunit